MKFVEVHITAPAIGIDMMCKVGGDRAATALEQKYADELQASFASMQKNLELKFAKKKDA